MTTPHKSGTWWRWLLMPIASLLAASVASGVLNVVLFLGSMLFTGDQPRGWVLQYVVPILSYGILGYVLALVAYGLSPRYKLAAGLVMTAVMLILFALSFVGAYLSHMGQQELLTHLIVGIPAACVTSVVALIQMHKGLLESPAPAGP